MNLTLIRMSGAGKSYIGKMLAERLMLAYHDLDEVMEAEHGKPLSEIIEALGDERFIDAETKTAIESTRGKSDLLISTGGSIIYSRDAMAHLSSISRVVYLDVPYETIESRIGGNADRLGRIVRLGKGGLRALYESRVPLYKSYADVTVRPDDMDFDSMLESIGH